MSNLESQSYDGCPLLTFRYFPCALTRSIIKDELVHVLEEEDDIRAKSSFSLQFFNPLAKEGEREGGSLSLSYSCDEDFVPLCVSDRYPFWGNIQTLAHHSRTLIEIKN